METVCCYTIYVLQNFDASCRHAAPKYTLSQLLIMLIKLCCLRPLCMITLFRLPRGVPRFPYTLEFLTKCQGSHWLKC